MQFNLFRRPDGALVVVPALFQSPLAMQIEGHLRSLGVAEVDLEHLTDEFVAEFGLHGYAIASRTDEALLRTAITREPARRGRVSRSGLGVSLAPGAPATA